VPAGMVTFQVFYDKPLYLTVEDQRTEADIQRAIKTHVEAQFCRAALSHLSDWNDLYQFVISESCLENFPLQQRPDFERCQARFLAEGLIAGPNFTLGEKIEVQTSMSFRSGVLGARSGNSRGRNFLIIWVSHF